MSWKREKGQTDLMVFIAGGGEFRFKGMELVDKVRELFVIDVATPAKKAV
jgi:hypothetical protein